MGSDELFERVWIVGPGRLGLAMGGCLASAATIGSLHFIGRSPRPPASTIFDSGAARYSSWGLMPDEDPSLILVTVPDAAVSEVAVCLAPVAPPTVPVLHTSGVLGSDALEVLAAVGNPIGSVHPLTAVADPESGAARLIGAWYAVEGDRAGMGAARRVVNALKGHAFAVEASLKPLYHAGAVVASNYVVVLMSIAIGMLGRAGVDPTDARRALSSLAQSAIEGVDRVGLPGALTGPISRGDAATIGHHLRWLSPEERSLYSGLARHALAIARQQGLEPGTARRVLETLESGAL